MAAFEEPLAAARKERGITQEQLAEAMNVSRQTVSHWENGRVTPDAETMKRLSAYLQLADAADTTPEEAAPMAEQTSAPAPSLKAGKPVLRLAAAFVCGALATLAVVYGLLPLWAKTEDSVPAQDPQEQTVFSTQDPQESAVFSTQLPQEQAVLPAEHPFE